VQKGVDVRHLIAIDGGGTGCRALIAAPDGRVLARAQGGAANINSDSQGALRNVVETARAAVEKAGLAREMLRQAVAVLGLAGANVGGNGERLRQKLPFALSAIHSDAVIATRGALGANDGVMGIVGTGSVFAAQERGEIRMIGGWGFAVGDLGSGARIGRALLERTLLAYDGIRPASALSSEIMRRFDDDPGRIVAFATKARPGGFAPFAPLVFDENYKDDRVACEVAGEAVRDVEQALDAVMPAGCNRICLLGGLAPLFAPRLAERYRVILRTPNGDALSGALDMALELARQEERA
jgi:glucosamine kinase